MKKKIKLRDLTQKENVKWCEKNCVFYGNDWNCKECIFYNVMCAANKQKDWIYHKDLYSDKFLDQEVEIDVPNILDKEEKEYLSAVIKPFRKKIVNIKKETRSFGLSNTIYYNISIRIGSETHVPSDEYIDFPYFKEDMYKGMEVDKCYTLEELGL